MGLLMRFIPPLTEGYMMFDGQSEIITCLYGMQINHTNEYEDKLKAALNYLGDKYILATAVEKKHG